MATKNAYFVRKIAWVTLANQGVGNVNLGWGDADFVVYKGAFSNLEFVVRDVDRKGVKLIGKRVCATLINNNTNELYLERELEIINPIEGRCKLVLTPGDLMEWQLGAIRYSLTIKDIDNNEFNYLYNDLNQEAIGYIEIRDRASPNPNNVIILDKFTPNRNIFTEQTTFYTGSIRGPGQLSYTNSMLTFAVYLENYTGSFFVEATLDLISDSDTTNWFKLELFPNGEIIKFDNKNGIEPYNLTGEYQWIRFGYFQTIGETGSVKKILIN